MKKSSVSFRAKHTEFKIAVLEKNMTLKELATKTETSYHTMLRIGSGSYNTSGIRAKVIANELGKNVEDLFIEVK